MVCFRKDLGIKRFEFPKPIKSKYYVEDILLPEEKVKGYVVERKDLRLNDNVHKALNVNKTIRVGIADKGGQGERIYSPKGVAITLSAQGGVCVL